jgi:hypothetical protein
MYRPTHRQRPGEGGGKPEHEVGRRSRRASYRTGVCWGSQEQGREEHGIDTEQADAELGAAYPAEELEWLATTLFNLAVDYYAGEEEEQGAEWARKAVKLADILATSWDGGDGGLLLSVLGRKMAELGWGVGDDYTS